MKRVRVRPGDLRLPPPRKDGADPAKLARQLRRFGGRLAGMPPLEVTLGADGEMMINDGVTRAVRVHRYGPPGTEVDAEIIDERPGADLSRLPRVREV